MDHTTGAFTREPVKRNLRAGAKRTSFTQLRGLGVDAAVGTVKVLQPGPPQPVIGAPSAVTRNVTFFVQPGDIIGVRRLSFYTPAAIYSVVSTNPSVQFPDGTSVGVANPPSGMQIPSPIDFEYEAADTVDAFCGNRRLQEVDTGVDPGLQFRVGQVGFDSFAFMD